MTIAKTILSQLGGNHFIVMTGAKNLTDLGNGISFKIMRNAKKVTHVRITLTPLDLYKVEFLKCRGFEISTISEHDMVYADQLASLFEAETGLYTYL